MSLSLPISAYGNVSVMDFGAIGDGIANDWQSIQDAIDGVLSQGGGTVFFPENKTFRITEPGVHGIHLEQKSNITLMGGPNTKIVMDNMVAGLAVSHGIFVEGPCENVSIESLHVKFATMAVERQTWAPIYFLGANVGTGNEADPVGWARGSYPLGDENPDGIAAGACKNVKVFNVTSENSPSTFCGLAGIDGVQVDHFTGIKSWADGIYQLYFRNMRMSNVKLYNSGDDGVSAASYESDLDNANILNDFHGEGSTYSNLSFYGRWPLVGSFPSGSVVILGVRDQVWTNIVADDKFAVIRVENGTQLTLDYPTLSLNFLANRGIVFNGISCRNIDQVIKITNKEVNLASDPKWWQADILIANLTAQDIDAPIDVYSTGTGAQVGGLLYGYKFSNLRFSNITNEFSNVSQPYNCIFENIESEQGLIFYGSVPYSGDVDAIGPDTLPLYKNNLCTFNRIKAASILLQGLKGCRLDNLESVNSPERGITFSTCADLTFGTVKATNANRTEIDFGVAVQIDNFCKRIYGNVVEVLGDDLFLPNGLSIDSVDNIRIEQARMQTGQATYYEMVSDALWSSSKRRQIQRIDWFNTGSMPGWFKKIYPAYEIESGGNADLAWYPTTMNQIIRYAVPITAARTITLHEDGASIGDRCRVIRGAGATGAFSLIIKGQTQATSGSGESLARGTFLVSGGALNSDTFSSITVNGGSNLLTAPIPWTADNETTANAIAQAITSGGGLYNAFNYRNMVAIEAKPGTGANPNGWVVVVTVTGNAERSNITNMAGGAAAVAPTAAGTPYTIVTGTSGAAGKLGDFFFDGTAWGYEGGTL